MRKPHKHPALSQIIFCVGGVCGGKGQAEVPKQALLTRWKQEYLWRACHISFSDCLGPCELANNACVLTATATVWLGELTPEDYQTLAEWAARCKQAARLLPLPTSLMEKQIQRFAEAGSIPLERRNA
ncbi:hypothetical protein [Meiothermus sp. CFH 77666]|uniref:hypothetical protein n=1 Tax=Meiothermus sp. CFH 77666 TaxID=2817942 RepID=UPI001AA07969|nr:hypothetical protein [Meiothermus sp. CFH 77666]MBO1437345.1 hypothetical protein [Meiothermus sp. CFH 77666]